MSMSGTSCGAENSWAARSVSWAISARRALQRPQLATMVRGPVRNGQGLVIEPPKHPVRNVSHGPSPFEARTPLV